ncbi:MAG: T9SS type A sorting domain-containing protein [Bacteroidota bacterium]
MKNLYLPVWVVLLCCTTQLLGQNDTLLFQDFQGDLDNILTIPDPDSLGTNNWINWDEDGLADANDRPQDWSFYTDLRYLTTDSIPPTDTNFVFGSSSWLQGFADGNRNWLVLPAIQVVDDQATLHWKSQPFQGPRYMDGYSVLVAVESYAPDDFTDTLFRHAQMIPPLPNGASDPDINAFNVDSFLFNPPNAYIHADRYTNTDFFFVEDTSANLYRSFLEPHSVSLADYQDQTIYICFLHDSDDDNLIAVDDILVLGTTPPITNTEEVLEADMRIVLYPNPAVNYVNLMYRFDERVDDVRIQVYDVQGKLMLERYNLATAPGDYTEKVEVSQLPSGQYSLVLAVNGQQFTRTFVRE